MKKFFTAFFFVSGFVFAQNYELLNQFGDFADASSFALSPQGYFYVADNGSDEIVKIDSLGNRVKAFGGYGWGEGQFDFPIAVSLNALNIFVTDNNNHNVQQFDKDLNFISRLSTRDGDNNDAAFGFPLCADISTMGDLYVLDSENKRIIKFDVSGNYLLHFGGFDAGDFSLKKPKKLIVTESNNVFVLDGKNLVIFDQFGNGVSSMQLPESFTSIDKYYQTITLTGDSSIYVSSFESDKLRFNKLTLPDDAKSVVFKASLVVGNKVYALTNTTIYSFVKRED